MRQALSYLLLPVLMNVSRGRLIYRFSCNAAHVRSNVISPHLLKKESEQKKIVNNVRSKRNHKLARKEEL